MLEVYFSEQGILRLNKDLLTVFWPGVLAKIHIAKSKRHSSLKPTGFSIFYLNFLRTNSRIQWLEPWTITNIAQLCKPANYCLDISSKMTICDAQSLKPVPRFLYLIHENVFKPLLECSCNVPKPCLQEPYIVNLTHIYYQYRLIEMLWVTTPSI